MNTEKMNILLADDDADDRYFFAKALEALPFPTTLKTVENGELLISHLKKNSDQLPDVLFLDLNMPRMNGSECLIQIKADPKLKRLPVIIYSTSLHTDVADLLYKNGAHYYVKKTELPDLKKILQRILPSVLKEKAKPAREDFVFSISET